MTALRLIAAPFVVAPPSGARVRTRLRLSETDETVLRAVGEYLGRLASSDLSLRCSQGRPDNKGVAESRRERKKSLTAQSSSRWAGAITRTGEDDYQLRYRNLCAEKRSLASHIYRIEKRLSTPVGGGRGWAGGYSSQFLRFGKQQRLQILKARLVHVESKIQTGQMSVCKGGIRLAKVRHNLMSAALTKDEWRKAWIAKRMFLTADGEADKKLGNETIRWDPDAGCLQIKLPKPLSHFANASYGRWRLTCRVTFPYRGDEVSAQTASGAVRYDISFDFDRGRWYLDASWKMVKPEVPGDFALHQRLLGIDLNRGHLAYCVVDCAGNPIGGPGSIRLELQGLSTPTRDGRIRGAIAEAIHIAKNQGCTAMAIEDLNFADNRESGREVSGQRPNRGKRGRLFRSLVSGIPTAKFRNRMVQMASNQGLAVIAVDPAYTSKWGAQHWLAPLKKISPNSTGHHAAAVVIGRRALGHSARRRERCDLKRPEDRKGRATNSAGVDNPVLLRHPKDREAAGQEHMQQKTRTGKRQPEGCQEAQDRSEPPTGYDSVLLSV